MPWRVSTIDGVLEAPFCRDAMHCVSTKGYASCGDACGVFLHLLQYLVAGANAVTFAFEEDAAVAIGENHQWVIIAKC